VTRHAPISESHWNSLAALADEADAVASWPAASWDVLRQTGALAWMIPSNYGGEEWGPIALLEGYEQLAAACLTTCFVLSQREGACRRLLVSGRETVCRELLPALARGERFATVGLSHLTTSRQHMKPSLRVRLTPSTMIFDGDIPWVTGAAHAQHLVIGATVDDGRQILAVLQTDLPGVSIGSPLELMALQGSMTAEVHCNGVVVDRDWLLAGPTERVMQTGRGGAGGLETSCLALGLTGAALEHLEREAGPRPELVAALDTLRRKQRTLREQMYRLVDAGRPAEQAVALRAQANALVLSATQAALTVSKGTGFVRQHPAQRWARQALFFLVWSCPWPAAAATLSRLSEECVISPA
jgi:alkylation response protein AidB-like acyl-CoA dehydrogenase